MINIPHNNHNTAIKNKIIIVTGATGTIGSAICDHLIKAGYLIIAVARNAEKGKQLFENSNKEQISFRSLDLLNNKAIEQLFTDPLLQQGTLRGVISCAGILKRGQTETFSIEDWDTTMQLNTSGTWYLFQNAIKKMKKQSQGGMLIAIGSRWNKGAKEAAAYAASKSALQGMIASLQKEFAGTKIRPMLVSPGSVASPMSKSVNKAIQAELLSPNDIAAMITYVLATPHRVIFDEIVIKAYNYDLTDQHA